MTSFEAAVEYIRNDSQEIDSLTSGAPIHTHTTHHTHFTLTQVSVKRRSKGFVLIAYTMIE